MGKGKRQRVDKVPTRDTIEVIWEALARQSIPDGAAQHQRDDLRSSFFCGATAVFRIFAYDLPKMPEDEGDRWVEAIGEELARFGDGLALFAEEPGRGEEIPPGPDGPA